MIIRDGTFSLRNSPIWIRNVSISGNVGDAIELGSNNIADISGLYVNGATKGIDLAGDSVKVTLRNSTFTSIGGTVFKSTPESEWNVTNTVINGATGDVFDLRSENTLFVAGNTFKGTIGGSLFSFEGTTATEVLQGSIGNINNVTSFGAPICDTGSGSFTGEIEIIEGTVVTVLDDGMAPCN